VGHLNYSNSRVKGRFTDVDRDSYATKRVVKVRAPLAVFGVVCFPSTQRCTVGNIRSAGRKSGPTYSFNSSDTPARWLSAV
jgi:hypothetical protein